MAEIKANLIKELSFIKNAKRVYRDNAANYVCNNIKSFPVLLDIVFDQNSKYDVKASWVLEIICQKHIHLLIPHLPYFTNHLSQIKNESALRPLSKICAHLSKLFVNEKNQYIKEAFLKKHQKKMIVCSFDWLIEDHKIATQVFAMDTLFYLGKDLSWVHEELQLILQQNTATSSAGYQARARAILKKI